MVRLPFSPVRLLKSPRLIVTEIGALVLSGVLMTVVPQEGSDASASDSIGGPVAAAVSALGLDRITRTGWFLGLVLLSGASLLVVLAGQARRARAEWASTPLAHSFDGASLRSEFLRQGPPAGGTHATTIRIHGRLGILGSPLFHAGLVLVAVAGIVRMAFGADAQVDLFEGESLPAGPSGWAAHWPGLMARPFSLDEPIRLDEVRPGAYPSGTLKALDATLTVGSGASARTASVSVNTPLEAPGGRLFVTALYGPTVFLSLATDGRETARRAVLLRFERGRWQGRLDLPGDSEARLSARDTSSLPEAVEVRLFHGDTLSWIGVLRPGEGAAIAPGTLLSLVTVKWWLRMGGTRDVSLWIAYAGFTLVALGALLVFTVIPVAEAVIVERAPEGERVTVALRPRRFAPLYADRLAALSRREGAPPG